MSKWWNGFPWRVDGLMSEFIPGLTLCGDFYREAVRPILDDAFPGLPHSAALIGSGSEVLGFGIGVGLPAIHTLSFFGVFYFTPFC